MIIGVDAGCLGIKDNRLKGGVYQMAVHLMSKMVKIDRENRYLLYSFNSIDKNLMRNFGANVRNKVLRPSLGWSRIRLPLEFIQEKPDVFLALSGAMPHYHPFKTIGFVHGLDYDMHYGLNDPSFIKLKKTIEYSLHHADQIIVPSYFLKSEIESKYQVSNVKVCYLGVDKVFSQPSESYKLDYPYFLCVGALKVSKNIPVLLEAFSYFLHTVKKDYYLVLIGSDKWLDSKIPKTIQKLHLNKYVKIINYVENKNLVTYYRGASAFVSPSIYESFGLPFVEAMAAECPVIGSTCGSIPEIVSNAGVLIDPRNGKQLAEEMVKIIQNIKHRQKLVKLGRMRAKDFSWEHFAQEVLYAIQTKSRA